MAGPSTAPYHVLCAAGDLLECLANHPCQDDHQCRSQGWSLRAVGEIALVLIALCVSSSPPATKDKALASLGCSALLRQCCSSSSLACKKVVSSAKRLGGASGAGVELMALINISALLEGRWSCRAASSPCPPAECCSGFPTCNIFGRVFFFFSIVTLPAQKDGLCSCSVQQGFHLIWKVIRYPGCTEPGVPAPCVLSGCNFCLFPPKRQEIKCSSS